MDFGSPLRIRLKAAEQCKLTGMDWGKLSGEFVMVNQSPQIEDFKFGSETLLDKHLSMKSLKNFHEKQQYLSRHFQLKETGL